MAESLGLTFRSAPLLALAALAPIVLILLLAREGHRLRLGRRFISERLRGVANPARAARPYLVALSILAGAVALAGPRAGFTVIPVENRETNRVIAIDVSDSMAAPDVGATRLDAAKAIAKRIIASNQGRIGLVVFEERADVMSPLTSDSEAVAALVDSIQPGEVSVPGTDLGAGLLSALRLLDSDPTQKGDVVVISDGEDQGSRLEEALRTLRQRGVEVSTVVVGSTSGSTIPREDGGELRDDNGDIVRTWAHPEVLERVARDTGGRFYVNPFAEHDLDTLAAPPGGRERRNNMKVPIERYQWPLAFAFLALLGGSLLNRGAE